VTFDGGTECGAPTTRTAQSSLRRLRQLDCKWSAGDRIEYYRVLSGRYVFSLRSGHLLGHRHNSSGASALHQDGGDHPSDKPQGCDHQSVGHIALSGSKRPRLRAGPWQNYRLILGVLQLLECVNSWSAVRVFHYFNIRPIITDNHQNLCLVVT
jgi:hypothetical protein